MLSTSRLPFLPAGRALRRHRDSLQHELAAEPSAHLLPGLLSLPLGIGPLPHPAAILASPRSIGLYGPPGGGRSLALLQVAHSWAESNSAAAMLYLPLAEADAPNLTPRAVIAGALHKAELPPAVGEGGRPGILLIDDWELLPADRRALWRSFLTTTARSWQALRAVVALPPGEPWPELEAVRLPVPDEAQAAAWLAHLLPGHDTVPLVAALGREPLAPLRASLADLALLALIYPLSGLPADRAELYEQAYALARPLLAETPRVGRAVLRHYRLARGLAGGDDLDGLAALLPAERAAVAPFAAGLLDDPSPVLALLWGDGDPGPADLQALAACAREWPGRAPSFDIRLVERLAAPAAAPDEAALLAALAPALPAILAAAGHEDGPRARAALEAADAALPAGPWPWLALVDDLGAPVALRWAAADRLAARPETPADLAAPPLADGTTLAARFYIAAVNPSAHHLLSAPPLRAGLEALLASPDAGERRAAAARAIVADDELPEELRAIALAAAGDRLLLERLAVDGAPAMRHAALAALSRETPDEALAALARTLDHPASAPATRLEALDAAARLPVAAATGLLARAAIAGEQPLTVRLRALDLLAERGRGGRQVLQRLLALAGLPPPLRAAAARQLGRLGADEALPALRTALEAADPLLRRAAAEGIGALGAREGLREQSAAALTTGLRRVGVDTVLGETIARALGHSGAALALPTLAALLGPELDGAMRDAWLRRAPGLASRPAPEWPAIPMPADARLALMEVLADGGTMADPPTRLAELSARQAARIAVAAAGALADLVALRPDLRGPALAALRRALADPYRTDVVRAALDALAAAGDPAAELAAILDDPARSAPLRWLAVERLGRAEAARARLLRRLDDDVDDAFLQSAALRLLGEHRQREALPTARRIARAPEAEAHLRRTAITALGALGGPEAAAALVAIAVDPTTPLGLRVAAADALPAGLAQEARAALHHASRVTRQAEVGVAMARALARSGDYDALPALVRSAQSDHGVEAVASIEAIGTLADPTVAPLFVRISQSPTASAGVRLAAVMALLRLGGEEHLTLLHEYLAASSPPLRLQAYGALAALRPDDLRLGEPLADPDAPMALRLLAVRQIAARNPDDAVIGMALAHPDEEPQVRLLAADALAVASSPRAVDALAAVLAPPDPDQPAAPPVLRRRCVETLGALSRAGGAASDAARERLTAIVADQAQPPEHRCWSAECLLQC